MVPEEVRAAVAGSPWPSSWEDMLPLLTVDEHGYPHVCLLSRAELDADGEYVYAVVAGPGTCANLLRTGQATLVVIDEGHAVYVKLDVADVLPEDTWLGVTLFVASIKRDGVGIPLAPPRYLVTEDLGVRESWDRSAALIQRMRSTERTMS